MGDRGNIAIIQNHGQVWFYTHWNGFNIKSSVKNALARQKRWDDETYLTRIIWDSFCGKENHGDEFGYGIGLRIGDNKHPIVVVDIPKQKIFMISKNDLRDGRVPEAYNPTEIWTFDEFSKLELDK